MKQEECAALQGADIALEGNFAVIDLMRHLDEDAGQTAHRIGPRGDALKLQVPGWNLPFSMTIAAADSRSICAGVEFGIAQPLFLDPGVTRARNRVASKGFGRKSSAPSSIALTTMSRLPSRPEMTSTGVSSLLFAARIRCNTSRPFMPGISMSSSTTSNDSA